MAGGFPIEGKPKEKTAEKMHPEILKRWIIFVAIVVAAAIILLAGASYVISQPTTNAQPAATTLSSSGGSPGGGMMGNGQPVVGTATPAQVGKETTSVSEFYKNFKQNLEGDLGVNSLDKIASVNNIPQEFSLGNNVFLTDLKITSKKISGYIENRDISKHKIRLNILFYPDGKIIDGVSYLSAIDGEEISIFLEPKEKKFFETEPGGSGLRQGRKIYDGLKDTKFIAVHTKIST